MSYNWNWRRKSQQRKRYVKRFLYCENVSQSCPNYWDMEARTKEPEDISGTGFSWGIRLFGKDYTEPSEHETIRERVRRLRKAVESIEKFTPRCDDDEPSIFHHAAFAGAISSIEEQDAKYKQDYELNELNERKKNDLARYEPERVPDHIRHWILTGEGVPTV